MTLPVQDQKEKKALSKTHPLCPRCKKPMDDRVQRGVLVKTFLFWLPLKRYKCYSCKRKRYTLAI